MKIVDTHCHLHRQEFDGDREQILARARAAGVVAFVDPATDLVSNRTVVALAQEQPDVYAAIGIHPHDVEQLTSAAFEELSELAVRPKVVAIGEIGLDYYRNFSPRDLQQEAFRKLLGLSRSRNLPVIIHCRGEGAANASSAEGLEIYRDLFGILKECLEPPYRGLLHCFGGSLAVANEAIALGLLISFAGNLTFSKADALRAVAREVPMEKVVLETDAPFLSPQAYRGKRNEPAYLTELIRVWSEIRGLPMEEVARITTENASHLFGFA